MHRIFVDEKSFDGKFFTVGGEDAVHIGRSLRMRVGEKLFASVNGETYPTVIKSFTKDTVTLEVDGEKLPSVEPKCRTTLYQALVKGDSADEIISRAAETGIYETVFFESSCCIQKAGDGFDKRLMRLNKISREAAMQSGRDIIPEVCGVISFNELLKVIKESELALFCYEAGGTVPIKEALEGRTPKEISLIIGPEGGFSPEEAEKIVEAGGVAVGLGKRILRARTAPAVAAACIMCMTEM